MVEESLGGVKLEVFSLFWFFENWLLIKVKIKFVEGVISVCNKWMVENGVKCEKVIFVMIFFGFFVLWEGIGSGVFGCWVVLY